MNDYIDDEQARVDGDRGGPRHIFWLIAALSAASFLAIAYIQGGLPSRLVFALHLLAPSAVTLALLHKRHRFTHEDGLRAYRQGRYDKAERIFRRTLHSDIRSPRMLGDMYLHGTGVPANADKAMRFYKAAAGCLFAYGPNAIMADDIIPLASRGQSRPDRPSAQQADAIFLEILPVLRQAARNGVLPAIEALRDAYSCDWMSFANARKALFCAHAAVEQNSGPDNAHDFALLLINQETEHSLSRAVDLLDGYFQNGMRSAGWHLAMLFATTPRIRDWRRAAGYAGAALRQSEHAAAESFLLHETIYAAVCSDALLDNGQGDLLDREERLLFAGLLRKTSPWNKKAIRQWKRLAAQ